VGASGGAFGWGIAIHARRNFSLTLSFRSHYGPVIHSTSNRSEYWKYFLECKGGRCVGLTALPNSCADFLEMWEPKPPGTLRASPGLNWDCFTFTKATGLVTGYGSLDDSCGPSSMQFSISRPVIYISLDPLTSTWLPSDLRQAAFWSKLSPLVCRHLTLICSTPICMFWDRGGADFKCHWWLRGGLMCTICYPCIMCTSKSE